MSVFEKIRSFKSEREQEFRGRKGHPENFYQRRRELEEETLSVLGQSGALLGLQQIREELLKETALKHELVLNLQWAEALLVWGEHFQIDKGTVDPERVGIFTKLDCAIVRVQFESQTRGLFIKGESNELLNETEWKDREKVDIALAQAFLYPHVLQE